MKKQVILALLSGLGTVHAPAQNPDSSKYIEVSYVKSKSPDFVSFETRIWKPLHQQLINRGKKSGWFLYHVKYPGGTSADYDYVTVNVYPEWNFLEYPNSEDQKKIDSLEKRASLIRSVAWKQLYQLVGQAVAKEKAPSRYIVVNEVKTVAGMESEYVKMEQTWFKPFHASRAVSGIMNNWGLYKRAFPYGDKFSFDYVTLNGFLNWGDITKNNPPDAWKKVHGDANFNTIHEKILSERITINNEIWELIDFVTK